MKLQGAERKTAEKRGGLAPAQQLKLFMPVSHTSSVRGFSPLSRHRGAPLALTSRGTGERSPPHATRQELRPWRHSRATAAPPGTPSGVRGDGEPRRTQHTQAERRQALAPTSPSHL